MMGIAPNFRSPRFNFDQKNCNDPTILLTSMDLLISRKIQKGGENSTRYMEVKK